MWEDASGEVDYIEDYERILEHRNIERIIPAQLEILRPGNQERSEMNSKTELKTEPEAEVKADSGTDSKAGFKTASGAGGRRRLALKAEPGPRLYSSSGFCWSCSAIFLFFRMKRKEIFRFPCQRWSTRAFGWIRGSASS